MSRQQDIDRDRLSELEKDLSDEKLKMAKLQNELNAKNERYGYF
jgi:hypothetical protein